MKSIQSSKLIVLLKTMSVEELRGFIRWLKSPWCNSNKNLPPLVEQLMKYHPEYKSRKLTKEILFEQILPDGKFSTRRMNNLMSEAYLAGEQFIAFQHLAQNTTLQRDLISQEFHDRRLDASFYKSTNELIDTIREKKIKSWEDHLELLKMHRRLYRYPNQDLRMQTLKHTITQMGEEIDWVFLLEKAAIINEKIFRNRILSNENYDIAGELKKWKAVYEGYTHPALELYRKRFEYTEADMLEQFFGLRAYFFEHFEVINYNEQRSQLYSLLNDAFYLRKKRKLNLDEIFPLYKFGFTNNLFLFDGIIPRITFTTVIVISNSLEDFAYSEHIINKYAQYLSDDIRKDAVNWAYAHTFSKKEQYEQCLEALLSHDFKSTYFQKITRVLTLQTYFELYLNAPDAYHEYLLSYCSAFEKWIQREKTLSAVNKEAYFRFIQKCRAMVKLYAAIEFSEEDMNQLFNSTKHIEAIDWLLAKQKQIIALKKNR
jgi:hypothetical protein